MASIASLASFLGSNSGGYLNAVVDTSSSGGGGGGSSVVLDNAATVTYPTAPQTDGVWYGSNTQANCNSTSVVIGNDATTTATNSIALGQFAIAGDNGAVSIGTYAESSNSKAVACGYASRATGEATIAIGSNAAAETQYAVVAGYNAYAIGAALNSVAVGVLARTTVASSIALGPLSSVLGTANAFGIGVNAASVTSAGLGATVNGVAKTIPLNFTTQDEGVTLSTAVSKINFVGTGVVASGAGDTTTVTIAGAGGGTPSYITQGVFVGDSATGAGVAADGRFLSQGYGISGGLEVERIKLQIGTSGTGVGTIAWIGYATARVNAGGQTLTYTEPFYDSTGAYVVLVTTTITASGDVTMSWNSSPAAAAIYTGEFTRSIWMP